MPSERIDEALLVKYLLGNLPETEQAAVEDRAFADGDYMGALEASEADLIDTYVRGGLSASERRAFEQRFLTSPSRRSKVEFARALAKVAAESAAPQQHIARPSFMDLLRTWSPALRLTTAFAALLCVAVTSWLMYQNGAMRSQIANLETHRRDLETQQQSLRRQLADEQTRAANSAVGQQQQQSALPAAIASLVLLPGLSRAATQTERLVLTPATQMARIDIQLEARDDYPRFRAELRTRRGEEVLSRGNLTRRRVGAGYSVGFEVPASALTAGNYELSLKGVAGDGNMVDIAYHYFSVRKQ